MDTELPMMPRTSTIGRDIFLIRVDISSSLIPAASSSIVELFIILTFITLEIKINKCLLLIENQTLRVK